MTLVVNGEGKLALPALDRALALRPDDATSLAMRSDIYRSLGRADEALADSAGSLKLKPKQPNLYLLRANIFRLRGAKAEGIGEVDALLAADPENGYAHVVASRILNAFGEKARAREAIDHAIALKPDVIAYLNRIDLRARSDLAGREADIEAALKLEPDSEDAVTFKAQLQVERGDFAGAAATYSTIIAKRPDAFMLRNRRGIAYAKSGDRKKADEDFAAAREKAAGPGPLNNICFEKAMAGVALERALDECQAALAEQPESAAIMDSKAFVLLRLGRFDEAIATYDKVLAESPTLAASLFGRAIALSRKGDQGKAEADFSAARKAYSGVDEQFARYGVTP
jgi:tetratricopeptide (TPR) repeat protein